MAHRQGAGADEAFPAGTQAQPFDRPASGVGPVQHPDRLAVLGGGFQDVPERGDEGVDAAAKVLKIHEDHVERIDLSFRGAAHFAIEAEDRNSVDRIEEVGRLDHVVLLVAAQAVLGTERRDQVDALARGQGVETVGQVGRHRGGVGEKGHPLAGQARAQGGVGQQPVDAEFHARSPRKISNANPSAW